MSRSKNTVLLRRYKPDIHAQLDALVALLKAPADSSMNGTTPDSDQLGGSEVRGLKEDAPTKRGTP